MMICFYCAHKKGWRLIGDDNWAYHARCGNCGIITGDCLEDSKYAKDEVEDENSKSSAL